tara:strand:- start:84 stop:569 length:486 start_codon:yes stop_codon:yes gene_type:complete
MKIKNNDYLPDSEVFILKNNQPIKTSVLDLIKDKKIILFGIPGAFTSTCSKKHLPGFQNNSKKFFDNGIEAIFCISVNDPFVMNAWAQSNNVERTVIMISDPYFEFTKKIGADIDRSDKGMGIRSKRYSMIIEKRKVVGIFVEKDTSMCDISAAETIIKNL